MTPEDFAASLMYRLRRKGVEFRPDDVRTFAADAWERGERSLDAEAWEARFLAAHGQGSVAKRPIGKRQGAGPLWTGLVFAVLGISGFLLAYLRGRGVLPPLAFFHSDEMLEGIVVLCSLLPVGISLIVLGLLLRYRPVQRPGAGLVRTGHVLTVLGVLGCLFSTVLVCYYYMALAGRMGPDFLLVAWGVVLGVTAGLPVLVVGLILMAAGLSFRYWPIQRPGGGWIRVGLFLAAPGVLGSLLAVLRDCFCPQFLQARGPFDPTPLAVAFGGWVALSLLLVGFILTAAGLSFLFWPVHRRGGGLMRVGLFMAAPSILWGVCLFLPMRDFEYFLWKSARWIIDDGYVAFAVVTPPFLLVVGLLLAAVGLIVRYWPRRTAA